MIFGTNLSAIPFISTTDSTRLQMSAKQIRQALTHRNCQVPYIIGKNWNYLSDSSKLFKYVMPCDGEVLYTNDDILILLLNLTDGDYIYIYEIPYIMRCHGYHSTTLRYKAEIGKLKKGQILYEYDSFNQGIPTYGYNINAAFMPWFGYNHEDAMVVSESFADRCRSSKSEKIIIAISESSLFQLAYPDSKYKIIPEIGQQIDGFVVLKQFQLNAKFNTNQSLKLIDENEIENSLKCKTLPILSKISNGTVIDIKIHKVNKGNVIYKPLQNIIQSISDSYYSKLKNIYNELTEIFQREKINELLSKYYIMTNMKDAEYKRSIYILELTVANETKLEIGDKIANRYANKGVVNLILPDELCPRSCLYDKQMDIILGPISVFSRMNFGQISEGIVSKAIQRTEDCIKSDSDHASNYVSKLSNLSAILDDHEYADKITNLSNDIKHNKTIHSKFLESIEQLGLYFEVKNFVKFNMVDLLNYTKTEIGSDIFEPIKIPRKTFIYMKEKMKLNDVSIPKDDVVYNHIFNGPMYFLKLKHESSSKMTGRDFGNYKTGSKQPTQGKQEGGGSSKLGQMELDGLIGAGMIKTVKEFFTVKSDAKQLKSDLVCQILDNGQYKIPKDIPESYTKLLIESLIETINNE